jgi:sugar lactone lactonase YvrE
MTGFYTLILVWFGILLVNRSVGNIFHESRIIENNTNILNSYSKLSTSHALKNPSRISRPSIALESISPNLFMQLVAGNGSTGYSGNNGPATAAQIKCGIPYVDSSGKVYIPNGGNHVIRRIDVSSGIIAHFGGSGSPSAAGVSAPLGSVSFNLPYSIVGDAGGTLLYICDQSFVWKYLFSSNIVTVFARSSTLGVGFSGDNGQATSAQLYNPKGIWLTTSGDLYIADYFNNRIRKIVTSSGIITTVAGSGPTGTGTGSYDGDFGPATSAFLNAPRGVYMNSLGNLFIADTSNHRIRMVETNNIITTFAGTGDGLPFNGDNLPAVAVQLISPFDVKGDSLGNMYIADNGNILLRKVDSPSGMVSTLFGTPNQSGFSSGIISSRASLINNPQGIWVDSAGTVYFSDQNSIHRGVMVSSPTSQPSRQPSSQPNPRPSGQPSRLPSSQPTARPSNNNQLMELVAGKNTTGFSGDNGPASLAQVAPRLPWVDSNGKVYIPDCGNHRIRRISPTGLITTFGGTGNEGTTGVGGPIASVSFYHLWSIVGDAAGTFLYISDNIYVWKYDYSTHLVSVFAGSTTLGAGFGGDNGPATLAQIWGPMGLWLTTSGVLYFPEYSNNCIRKVNTSNIISTVAGFGTNGGSGGFSGDGGPATLASLSNPGGVYMNTAGRLFIADRNNHRIRTVDTNGIIVTYAGTGTYSPFNGDYILRNLVNLNSPWDVKGDNAGNIFITDSGNCLIRKIDVFGIITSLMGTAGQCGFFSGITSLRSSINNPIGLWVDELTSRVYVSDENSIHRSFIISSPTSQPSGQPSQKPSGQPTRHPSGQPSRQPTTRPSTIRHLTPNLIASYPFSGNALDGSGNGNHGTVHSATLTTDRFGNTNNAYSFNGVNSYIEIVDGTAFNFGRNFSISLWVKPTSSQQSASTILSNSHRAANGWSIEQIGTTTNKFRLIYTPTNYNHWKELFQIQLTSNVWNHLIITKNGFRTDCYLNNNLLSTGNTSSSTFNSSGNFPLTIGAWNFGHSQPASQLVRFFSGVLDDIRIYNRSLSRSEVSELFFAENPVPSRKSVFSLYNGANSYSIQSLIINPLDSSSYFLGGYADISGGTNSLLGKFLANGNKDWFYEQTVLSSYAKPNIQTITTLDDTFLYAGGTIFPPTTFPGYNGNFVPYISKNSLVDGTLLSAWTMSSSVNGVVAKFIPTTNHSLLFFGYTGAATIGEFRPNVGVIVSAASIGTQVIMIPLSQQ